MSVVDLLVCLAVCFELSQITSHGFLLLGEFCGVLIGSTGTVSNVLQLVRSFPAN